MVTIALRRVDYYFVKAGELHRGLTFLAVSRDASEEEITEIIKQRGIHIVGIKQPEKEEV